MAKQNNNGIWIFLGIIIASIIIAPNLNIDISNFFNQDNTSQFENNQYPEDGSCSYSFEDKRICVDETGRGLLTYVPNAECQIGFQYTSPAGVNMGWRYYGSVTLNSAGEIYLEDTPGIAGTYEFRAVCNAPDGDVCSNSDTIIVETCSDSSDDSSDDSSSEQTTEEICSEKCVELGWDYGSEYTQSCGGTPITDETAGVDCCCYYEPL